jgi:hypothetical protein
MRFVINLLLLVFFQPLLSVAQNGSTLGNNKATGIDMNPQPGGFVRQMDLREAVDLPEYYHLYDDYRLGNLYFDQDRVIKSTPLKFDILNEEVIIKTEKGEYVVPFLRLDSARLYNVTGGQDLYLVKKQGKYNSAPVVGFYQQQNVKENTLITKYSVNRIKSSYNQALDAGIRGDKFRLVTTYIIIIDNNEYSYEGSRRKFLKQLTESDREKVRAIIKSNNLNINNQNDLMKLLTNW